MWNHLTFSLPVVYQYPILFVVLYNYAICLISTACTGKATLALYQGKSMFHAELSLYLHEHIQSPVWLKANSNILVFSLPAMMLYCRWLYPGFWHRPLISPGWTAHLHWVTSNKLLDQSPHPRPQNITPGWPSNWQHMRPNFCSKLTPRCAFFPINSPWADCRVGIFSVICGSKL